jgi:hypothetical protein
VQLVFPCFVFLSFASSLCCCLLLASNMVESSHCYRNCNRNLVWRLVFSLAFTHCREPDEISGKVMTIVTIIHATVDGPRTGVRLALLFILLFFFWSCALFSVSPFLLWNSLWLVEVLSLHYFFLITRMGISDSL